jgi:hypothetical protein
MQKPQSRQRQVSPPGLSQLTTDGVGPAVMPNCTDNAARLHALLLVAANALPLRDSIERWSILLSLLKANHHDDGRSIGWIAHDTASSTEATRHHLRVLRSEGAVVLAGNLGRTELFKLSEKSRTELIRCLEVL